ASAGLLLAPGLGTLVTGIAASPARGATIGGGRAQSPGASPSEPTVVPTAGGTLNAAVSGNPDKLDPRTYALYGSRQLFGNPIFSNLLEMDSNGSFYGVLATNWSNPTATTYVFDLVPNAVFHNGEAFTSADVKYSFMRILDPKTASNSKPLF